MVSAVYCSDCGAKSDPYRIKCGSCGVALPSQVKKNPLYAKVSQGRPKAAVFDLDGTLFDNFQRFKDARRAGLIDNDGKPVRKGNQSMGAAWKKRNKFLYSKKNLAKDTVIPGAKELVTSLSSEGYIIVYLTARPKEYYTEILGQLESNGFPLFRDNAERVMLITKPPGRMNSAEYKGDEVRKLRGEFDVRMVFDDDLDALAEISKYDVPGLYASVSDHIKVNPRVRRNGNHFGVAHEHRGETYVTGTDNVDTAYKAMPDPDDPDGRTVGQTLGEGGYAPPVEDPEEDGRVITPESVQMSLDEFGENIRENPVKRGKDSKGPFYKWGKGKKYHYKAGNEKSREAARKKAYEQAKAAFAGGYRKNPREVKTNPANNLANTFGDFLSTGSINDTKFAKLMDAKTPAKISSDKISFKGVGTKNVKVTFKQVKDPSKVITYNDTKSEGDNPLFFHSIDGVKATGKSLIVDGYLSSGWRTFHETDYYLSYRMRELGFGDESFESVGFTVSQICQDKDGFYLWDGKEKTKFKSIEPQPDPKMSQEASALAKELFLSGLSTKTKKWANLKKKYDKLQNEMSVYGVLSNPFGLSIFGKEEKEVKKKEFSATIQYPTIALVRETPKSSIKLMLIHYTGAVKTNPAHPKKVEKGKKLYKHMNGQAPEKVKVEKIDIGDVWYKVGEGGCWQIGYMSGKETGQESQKYIHTFNEETQDGNFPELYATMPEKGKPMLIIKGGTWKIRTDDQGVAWIYD